MGLRTVLAAILIANTHFSVCVGGLLNVSAAIAASVPVAVVEDVPMTPAHINYLSCTYDTEQKDDNPEVGSTTRGCADGSSCLKQAKATPIVGTLAVVAPSEVSLVSSIEENYFWNAGLIQVLARAGPLYEHASYYSHALIKLE